MLPEDQRKAVFAKKGSDEERAAYFARHGRLAEPPKVPLNQATKVPPCPGPDCPSCSKGRPCRGKRSAQALVRQVLNSPLNWRLAKDARTAIGIAIMHEAKRQGIDPAAAVTLWEDTCTSSSVLDAIKHLGKNHSRKEAK
jgi:hypothetical protein